MAYKLIITERADELIDNHIYYLLYRLKNKQAASHLLDGIESIYDRLEDNPRQFPVCPDTYLGTKGYREAIVPQMDYIVIFSVEGDTVYVVGVFHQSENYTRKV